MTRRIVLVVSFVWSAVAGAATVDFATTGQFEVQGAQLYRSVELPVAFVVLGSKLGRPVLISTGPVTARLLDPARVTKDPADATRVRVDTGGTQGDTLVTKVDGSGILVDRDGITLKLTASPPVLGDHTLDQVLQAMPEYRRSAARYTPDTAALDAIRRAKQPTELFVVFGSWCSHCEQLIPRLVRVLQDSQGAPLTVTFHGVPADGAKDQVADDLRVSGLPTAIVRRDGKELARIEHEAWEAPEKTLAALVAVPAR